MKSIISRANTLGPNQNEGNQALNRLPVEVLDEVARLLPLADQLSMAQTNRFCRAVTHRHLALQAPPWVPCRGVSRQPALELLNDPRLATSNNRRLLAYHWATASGDAPENALKTQLLAFRDMKLVDGLNPLRWTCHAGIPTDVSRSIIEFLTDQKPATRLPLYDILNYNRERFMANYAFKTTPSYSTSPPYSAFNQAQSYTLDGLIALRHYNTNKRNEDLLLDIISCRDMKTIILPFLKHSSTVGYSRTIISASMLDRATNYKTIVAIILLFLKEYPRTFTMTFLKRL